MKKVTFLLGLGSILSMGAMQAQEVIPADMTAISNPSEIELTVKDDRNRSKNDKPMVLLPDGTLVFTAKTAGTGEELYICKDDQISLLKDIVPGETGSNPSWLTVVDDNVFFAATTPEHGAELWVTDGTEEGTTIVKDIYEGETGSELFGLTAFNGKCLFFARNEDCDIDGILGQNGEEWLWVSDGTEEGTENIGYQLPTRRGIDGMSGYIVPSGSKAFFIGYHQDYNETLYTTDGTADGTQVVKDIYPLAATDGGTFKTQAATIDWMAPAGDNRVVFRANTLNDKGERIGVEIWYSDGTADGTRWVGVDYNPGETDGVPNGTEFAFPTYYNGKVYFRAKDGIHGCEPGVTDFTAEGTHYISDINFWSNDPIYDSWGPENPFVWKGYLFCRANGSYYWPADSYHDSGYSLWRYNLAEDGVTPTAENGLIGFQYQSNWTNGVEIFPENNGDEPNWFTACGGRLYFRAQDVANNNELWKMESVDDTPEKVSDMEGDSKPHSLTKVGTALYFVTTTTKVLYKYNPEPIGPDEEPGSGVAVVDGEENAFFVYPNPAIDRVEISSEQELAFINIIDMTGKRVLSQAGNERSVNVSALPAGIYMVYAQTTDGQVFTTKLSK